LPNESSPRFVADFLFHELALRYVFCKILKGLAPIQPLIPCAGKENDEKIQSDFITGVLVPVVVVDAQVIIKLWSLFTFPVDVASDPVWV